jgi:formate hydrogenlyase subunit 3/multisubunit Na+/H+ antiporter MnhD subunit
MAAFLILSGLMIGVFSALDGMLFYVFFEATLIPMYIIIGVWGGPNRVYRVQVLPVHAARLAADAGRADLPVQQVGLASTS